MTVYKVAGSVPPKRFTKLQSGDGRFIHEELFSSQGFAGVFSLVYRLNAPTRVASVEVIEGHDVTAWETGPVDKHLFDLNRLDSKGDFFESRRALAFNEQITYSLARVTSDMEDSTKEPEGLLEACLSWQPGNRPFEQLPAVMDFAGDDPRRIEKMRLLGWILAHFRKPVTPPGNSNVKEQ